MTPLDAIKGGTKLVFSLFMYGEDREKMQAERLYICQTSGANGGKCGYLQELNGGELGKIPRCGHCGCFLLAKTKFEGEKCPLGRW